MFKRLTIFLVWRGLLCHVLGTFLYAIAFVGNFAVPRTLELGARGYAFLTSLLVDLLLLGAFAARHMPHGAAGVQALVHAPRFLLPPSRSTYVLASSLALILMFANWRLAGW